MDYSVSISNTLGADEPRFGFVGCQDEVLACALGIWGRRFDKLVLNGAAGRDELQIELNALRDDFERTLGRYDVEGPLVAEWRGVRLEAAPLLTYSPIERDDRSSSRELK